MSIDFKDAISSRGRNLLSDNRFVSVRTGFTCTCRNSDMGTSMSRGRGERPAARFQVRLKVTRQRATRRRPKTSPRGCRAAYRAGDAKGVRALLVENYRRLQKSDPERIKAELSQLTQVVGTVDLAGPTLTYLLALQGQQVGQGQGELSMRARTELDKTLASLVEATLNPRSELACLRVQQRLLEELASGRPVSQELWLENLACDSEQNTPDPITLRDDLVLDAIDAPASFVYLFDRPPGIAIGFSARIDPSPPQPVIFNSDGRQLVLQTLPLREVPADARTQVYTITLTSAGRDHVYDVVLPVTWAWRCPCCRCLCPGRPSKSCSRARPADLPTAPHCRPGGAAALRSDDLAVDPGPRRAASSRHQPLPAAGRQRPVERHSSDGSNLFAGPAAPRAGRPGRRAATFAPGAGAPRLGRTRGTPRPACAPSRRNLQPAAARGHGRRRPDLHLERRSCRAAPAALGAAGAPGNRCLARGHGRGGDAARQA